MIAEKLKLNLGSRDRNVKGFQNVDIDKHPGVDFVCDVSDLSQFKDESVSEILASNILEHFPHVRTVEVLKEWRRVLEPGGLLYLSVPDFKRTVDIYLQRGLEPWIQNFICGDQGYATAFHYAIFDTNSLRELVAKADFSEISIVNRFAFTPGNDCSNLKSTVDGKLVCLNAVVVK